MVCSFFVAETYAMQAKLRKVRSVAQGLRLRDATSVLCDGIVDALARGMLGFITERNFEEAEREFPGIVALYEALPVKPVTFLELLQRYLSRSLGRASNQLAPSRSHSSWPTTLDHLATAGAGRSSRARAPRAA